MDPTWLICLGHRITSEPATVAKEVETLVWDSSAGVTQHILANGRAVPPGLRALTVEEEWRPRKSTTLLPRTRLSRHCPDLGSSPGRGPLHRPVSVRQVRTAPATPPDLQAAASELPAERTASPGELSSRRVGPFSYFFWDSSLQTQKGPWRERDLESDAE